MPNPFQTTIDEKLLCVFTEEIPFLYLNDFQRMELHEEKANI